jgi:peptidoglycan L-alanyl-D-glutamate endopeptidase CwlK
MEIYEMRSKEPKYWQRLLRLAGYYKGRIDGIRGPLQEAAEFAWERAGLALGQMHGLFDERSEENIRTLMPPAQKVARIWLDKAKRVAAENGVDVKIICGTRTYGEQDALYKKRPKVTNAKGGYSWHNFGLAFDFGVFSIDGKKYFGESPLYDELGSLTREVQDAEWGGDWSSFKDKPHIQMRRFNSIAEARKEFERK